MDRANQFCQAAAQHNSGREKHCWRYPHELKQLAIEFCRETQATGRSLRNIAAELGLSKNTLSRWLAQHESAKPSLAGFHSVRVVEPLPGSHAASTLRVVTPGGLRIEGLTLSRCGGVGSGVAMIGLLSHRRVYAYAEPVDLRKGFDGLYALTCDGLGRDPLCGDLFLFVSRNRIRWLKRARRLRG